MLSWSLAFFFLALLAAIFGFGGIAEGAAEIGQILFIMFLAMFVVSLVRGLSRRRPPRPPIY
jgi:uncharacterized membrane protein YtjA (UPF0391 family)